MKKFAILLALTLSLSTSVLADGEIPIGGRTCPSNQACRTAPATAEQTEKSRVKEVYNSSGFSLTKSIMNFIMTIF